MKIADQSSYDFYSSLTKSGISNEIASLVLPMSNFVHIQMNVPVSMWIYFLKRILSYKTAKDVLKYGNAIYDILTYHSSYLTFSLRKKRMKYSA